MGNLNIPCTALFEDVEDRGKSEMMKSVVEESRGASDNGGQDGGNFEHPDMDPVHIGHCVGYIAQVRGLFHFVRMIHLADMWCISIFCALQTVPLSHLGSDTIMEVRLSMRALMVKGTSINAMMQAHCGKQLQSLKMLR